MNNNLLQIKIKQRLNKLSSFDYDNIECWMIQEAFNKAQLEWVRRQIAGVNIRKEGSEQSTTVVDDLQKLIKQSELSMVNKTRYFESKKLPSDYLRFVRVDTKAKSDCCPEKYLTTYLVEEANISIILGDKNKEPNFEWAETICTLMNNQLRIYTEDKFIVTNAYLIYYRLPRLVQFKDCVDISTGTAFKVDQTCEFNDDVAEILVDETAAILAGDIESIIQNQRLTQTSQNNS
jgi:hypothetical protein